MSWDLKVTKVRAARRDFNLGPLPAGRQPLVFNKTGTNTLVTIYLNYLRRDHARTSCSKHAYVLAVWTDHLSARGIHLLRAGTADLHRFIYGGAVRDAVVVPLASSDNVPVMTSTLQAAIDVITNFYRVIDQELKLFKSPLETRNRFLGLGFTATRQNADREARPTPNHDDSKRVIDDVSDKATAYCAASHNLIVRLEYYVGFRAQGTTTITTIGLSVGLRGIQELASIRRSLPKDLASLAGASPAKRAMRNRVRDGVIAARERGKSTVSLGVFEKGAYTYGIVPIELFLELLDFTWGERHELILKKRRRDPSYSAPPNVILSYQTGLSLLEKSVSNLVARSFKKLDILGSGHRLRAGFAENQMRKHYHQERALHGRGWQQDVVFELVREAMRQRKLASLRPYLNKILTQEHALNELPILLAKVEIAPIVRAILDALNGPNGAAVEAYLVAALEEFNLHPIEEAD
ncbi:MULTISPECIES: hypothetical protein [Rhizobium]|uniref:hypothetical protein n=1 Tax=Rhizobium TaxID=379 RepID=UPI00102F506C|nr:MULTISPECIES: hypothetical protein [Rhizobium]TAV48386.1 hypothetical protein ELI32_09215 [Rhizobium leguminosarum]TAV57886.1 hypothetical protein ELI31_08745 [Rhizobium leguminosarum]TAV68826.1 hypothetical protein ELI30_08760 [Rhizobium leguminosarum]TBE06181.1 hypothetical protein ELH12_09220 [Rhizobium ruizarguesonis]TBE77539.1 hypothetical protein ELH01_10150 [Rhizobium ruizarguesonis]